MLGLTYLGIELAHAVGIFSAGPITDKLVRHLREGCIQYLQTGIFLVCLLLFCPPPFRLQFCLPLLRLLNFSGQNLFFNLI